MDKDTNVGDLLNTPQSCSSLLINSEKLQLKKSSCQSKLPFVCQQSQCNKKNSTFACYLGSAYRVEKVGQTFSDAKKICTASDSTIAVFNDGNISSYIMSLFDNVEKSDINIMNILKFLFQGPVKTRNVIENVAQFFMIQCQLTIIIGLCMDNGESFTSKLLRTKFMQFFGRISLSLYLLQLPIFGCIELLMNQYWVYNELEGDDFENLRLFSSCYIFILVTPLIASLANKYFEEPISSILRRII